MVPLIESIRRGFGGHGSLLEMPGTLFGSGESTNAEDQRKTPDMDKAASSGLVFLMLCYTWEGYIFPSTCSDFIFLGDGFVKFSSVNAGQIDEAMSLMKMFELQPLTSSPWN